MEQLFKIVFLENSTEGLFIIGLLIIVLIVAVHFARLHNRRYRVFETKMLDRVMAQLKSLTETKADDGSSNILDQLIKGLPRDRKGNVRDSLISDRLLAIKKMRSSQSKISIQALQEMSTAKEVSRKGLGFPSFVVGFAMLLGLLGTIIGLTKMVQTIHLTLPAATDALTPDKWSQSLENVRNVLSSMKSAFSATLVGLVCSITASILNLRLENSQSRFFEKLERFTIQELLPRTAPSIEDETLLEKVSTQMELYFDELGNVVDKNNQTIKELSSVYKAFETTITNVQEISRRDASGSVQQVIGQMASVVGELSKVNDSIVKMTGRIPETLDLARKGNEAMKQRLDALVDSNKRWQVSISNTLTAVPAARANVTSTPDNIRSPQTTSTVESAPAFLAQSESLDGPLTKKHFLVFGSIGLFFLVVILEFFR